MKTNDMVVIISRQVAFLTSCAPGESGDMWCFWRAWNFTIQNFTNRSQGRTPHVASPPSSVRYASLPILASSQNGLQSYLHITCKIIKANPWFFLFAAVEEGHEGLTQFLMNEVMKLQEQSKVKTLQHAELSRKNCTLEDEQKKLRLVNQELQTSQQSKQKTKQNPILIEDLQRPSFMFK